MDDDSSLLTETQPGPPAPGAGPLLEPGDHIGRYLVLEHLGGGGMGVVYTAYDPELDRKIVLKLLREEVFAPSARDEAQQRLLREAQALARLNHPNVVAVHDIGLSDGQVFIAMELVQGQDLQRWLNDGAPAWQRVVEIFFQAGEGLAAAHRAGLLHRDFKPANVLLGNDGRVRVVDFGLARPVSQPEPETDELEVPVDPGSGSGSALDRRLTLPGRRMGTPAFMAPEQLNGEAVDARSDQFSFCVALFTALYGRLPFDRSQSLWTMERVPVPRGTAVPTWLEKIVLRGLSMEPEDRFETMDRLLAELDRRRHRHWGRVVAVVGAMLLALVLWHPWAEDICRSSDHLAGVWDSVRKRALADAFERSTKEYAMSSRDGVFTLLDTYAGDWTTARIEACEATHVHKEQSEQLLDLRMACLHRRLGEMRALVELMIDAEPAALERGVQAVSRLGSLSSCADASSLTAVVPLPRDPETQARIEGLRPRLDQLKGLCGLMQNDAAWALAQDLEQEVRDLDYAPFRAEALFFVGSAAAMDDRPEKASDAYLQAVSQADAGRNDALRISAMLALVLHHAQDPDGSADLWLEAAEGALERAGNPELWADFHQVASVRKRAGGEYRGALDAAETAFSLSVRRWGTEHLHTSRHLATVARAQQLLGDHARALESITEVARIHRRLLGDKHPEVAYFTQTRGELLKKLGRYEEAVDVLEEALNVLEASHGPEHSRLIPVLRSLGNTHSRLGRLDQAEAMLQRVVELHLARVGAEHGLYAAALHDQALVVWNRGDLARTEAMLRQVAEILEKTWGSDHPMSLIAGLNQGRLLLELDRVPEALAGLEPGYEAATEKHGRDHLTTIGYRLALGEARLAAGRPRAHGDIDTAARLAETVGAEPWMMALVRFAQARSDLTLGDVESAHRHTAEARALFESMAGAGARNLERLNTWSRRLPQTPEVAEHRSILEHSVEPLSVGLLGAPGAQPRDRKPAERLSTALERAIDRAGNRGGP